MQFCFSVGYKTVENKKNTIKKDYIWNMIGSVCYSASSFYYLMLVTRAFGVNDGGVFALAFATAQLLLTFGRYGMRTYQATDVQRSYSFSEYGVSRIITCVGMVLFAWIYSVAVGYSFYKTQIFVWVAAMKMIDAVEDVYHGEIQRGHQVALMGKLLAARNLFSCVVFGVAVFLSHSLNITCFVTAVLSLIFAIAINHPAVIRTCEIKKAVCLNNLKKLFLICFPIFISTFLSLYLYNIPKYAIDSYLTEDIQTYYSIMFMPSFVISLFSEIITKPIMTDISVAWEKDIEAFKKSVVRIYSLIAGGTVIVVFGGHFIGRWLLEIFYGVSLKAYKADFIILLIGGGISAAVYISYNILIAIRFEKSIILVYLAVAALATPLTYGVVRKMGMTGAAWSYLLTCLLLEIIFGSILLWKIREKKHG